MASQAEQPEEAARLNQRETLILIEVWRLLKETKIIDAGKKNTVIKAAIKEEMASRGITNHCPDKLHKRIQDLRREYNKVKDENKESGGGRKTFLYFHEIDQFQSSSSLTNPKHLSDSGKDGEDAGDAESIIDIDDVGSDPELEGSSSAFKSPPHSLHPRRLNPITPKSAVQIKEEPGEPGKRNTKAGAESSFVSGLSPIEKHRIDREHELEVKKLEFQQRKEDVDRIDKERDRILQLELAKVNADMMANIMKVRIARASCFPHSLHL